MSLNGRELPLWTFEQLEQLGKASTDCMRSPWHLRPIAATRSSLTLTLEGYHPCPRRSKT